jgi:hypothetical protein
MSIAVIMYSLGNNDLKSLYMFSIGKFKRVFDLQLAGSTDTELEDTEANCNTTNIFDLSLVF